MPKSTVGLNQRKKPKQKRSQDTCAVILEAASDVIIKEGLDALNTNRIAERAGVSVGSLYQYFPGKKAILATLIRDMRREMLEDFESAVDLEQRQDLSQAINVLVEASLRHHLRNPALTKALEQAEDDLPLNAETQALKAKMAVLIVELLKQHGVGDVERTAFDLIALSHGITQAATQAGQDDHDELTQRVLRAVRGYLGLTG